METIGSKKNTKNGKEIRDEWRKKREKERYRERREGDSV
jgi:hypothetical protein